jgi:alpha-L-fucosidase
LALVLSVCGGLSAQTYQPDWDSLDKRPTPEWFQDSKFGIFIHWGVYSVPAYAPVGKYSEWYWNSLAKGPKEKGEPNPTYDFHKRVYGENFPYADFAPMFRAEMYDPAHWAEVFQKSGAKYVVLTSKHHDGFALWPSEHANRTWNRPWNAAVAGPKRDVLGDLTKEVRERGVRMGFYYSLYEWYNPLWQADRKKFVVEHMHPQFKDLVTRYKPSLIFSDGEWDMTSQEWKSPELLAWLFNDSDVKNEVVVNDRWGKDSRHKHGGYWTTEYTAGLDTGGHPWEESRGMGFSYGYNRAERLKDYRTDRELILMLVDLVSRGGNLLLDIGPTGDGRIPVVMEERLMQIGQWLAINGDAIYGTRPWKLTRQWSAGEQPKLETGEYMTRYEVSEFVERKKPGQAIIEAFFTSKADSLYAIVPGAPAGKFVLKNVGAKPGMTVELLGHGPLEWKKTEGLEVSIPRVQAPVASQPAHVLRFKGVEPR